MAMDLGPAAGESDARKGNVEDNRARSSLCRWVAPIYRQEFFNIMKLAGPLALSQLLVMALKFVITMFCGHIGSAELAGFALASAMINVGTTAIGVGLTRGCDTLVSQLFGSQNLKHVGVIMQRSFLILMLYCLPCWGLLLNFSNIALLLQQVYSIVRIANVYVVAFLPAIPAVFLFSLMSSYLQNQGITLPQMYCTAVTNVFNVISNYVLIFSLELGGIGCAIANSLCEIVGCLLLFTYIRWKKLHLETWDGWSMQCLQDWGSYMRLAVPSAFVVCFDWWIYEILSVLAGVLGETALAAQHVIIEIAFLTLLFHLAIADAACVRVGNSLGANDTKTAIASAKVSLCISGTIAVVQGIIIGIIKPYIGSLFTSDLDIVESVSQILTINTFSIFFEALLIASTGICMGAGLQKLAAVANLIAYYGIGLAVGSALIFATELGLLGLWIGFCSGIALESLFFLGLFHRMDWKKLTIQARKRSGVNKGVDPTNKAQCKAVVADSDHQSTADCNPVRLPTAEGYSLVSTQEPKVNQEREGNKAQASPSVEDVEQTKYTSRQPKVQLSNNQLLLRRGLTVFIAALLFFTGVVCHIAIPILEPTVLSQINGTMSDSQNVTSTPMSLWGVTPTQSQQV